MDKLAAPRAPSNFLSAVICNARRESYHAAMNDRENQFTNVIENADQVKELEQAIQEHGKEWLHTADEWIRHNPYLALGVAVAVGCCIGACLRNRE